MYKTLDSNIISDIEYHDKTVPGSMTKEVHDISALGCKNVENFSNMLQEIEHPIDKHLSM
jgi:hypothetical protein